MKNRVKNRRKHTFAVLLSAIMILAMGTTVFAANGTVNKGKVTINEDAGNTYTAYKIANAINNGQDSAGEIVYTYEITTAFKDFFSNGANGYLFTEKDGITTVTGEKVESDGIGTNTNASVSAKLAATLAKYAREKGIDGIDVGVNGGVELDYGYYVIVETTSAEGTAVASKPILVDVKGDVTINPKDDNIDLDKKIVENEQLTDANNVNIGDRISFEVNTSIPTYEANVDKTKLKYILTDTFTHMDYQQDSLTLTIGNTVMTVDTDYSLEITDNGFVITLKPDTIYNHQGEDVKLTYSAILNKDAVVDSVEGNPNEITLEYTNNPNQNDSFDTITDKTKTFTYGFKLHKVDKYDNTKDMAGAQFTIKREDGTVIGTFTYGENGEITATGVVIETEGNYATLSGLDAGKYTIEETKAPNGYALLDGPLYVTIADKGEAEGGLPTGIAQITVEGQGTAESDIVDNGDGTIDLIVKVENVKGISLPETGAKTAMYCMIGGGVLLLFGGVYFGISRKIKHN